MSISFEPPPSNLDPELSAWLVRLINEMDIRVSQTHDFEILYNVPTKLREGMVRYFGDAIANTDITSAGAWVYNGTEWIPLNTTEVPTLRVTVSNASLPDEVVTKIPLDSNIYDSHGWFDVTNHRYKPLIKGYYQVNCTATITKSAGYAWYIYIYRNGVAYSVAVNRVGAGQTQSSQITLDLSQLVLLDGDDDYLEAYSYTNGDATAGTINYCSLSAYLVRRT